MSSIKFPASSNRLTLLDCKTPFALKKLLFSVLLEKLSINLYVDIQNVYNAAADQPAFLDVVRDDMGNPLVNPLDPTQYQTQFINNSAGTILPTIGIIVDF